MVSSNPWFPEREKLRDFANEEYKQEAFNPVRGALGTMAIQKYSAVFSVRNKLLRSNEIDLKKPKLREAMTFFFISVNTTRSQTLFT